MQSTKQSFYFREDKDGNKRPTVTVDNMPQVEVNDLIEVLADEEATVEQTWILDAVNTMIQAAARKQIDSGAEELDLDKLTIEFLASQPKSSRGLGISKEDWEAFKVDYITTFTTKLGKEQEKAEKAAALLAGKYNAVKANKAVIEKLAALLNQWFANSDNAEQFTRVFEYLTERAEVLTSEEANDLENFL